MYKDIFLLVLITVLIQLLITYFYTNTKEFSYRALIRNLSFVICIYLSIKLNKYYILLIPIILEIILEYAKIKGIYIEKYIATKYQYNDYWRDINEIDPLYSNFSEGNYDNIIGLNTKDHSQENIKKIADWCKIIYDESLLYKNKYLYDINGNKHNGFELKLRTDYNKFKLIANICKIKPNMKILEIGFGEGDFMIYIKKNYNIDVVGVSISSEQVKIMKSKGFKAYCLNSWDMTSELLGTYDLILQCGNLEYVKCTGDSNDIYIKYSNIIKNLLNKNGKYFITCIHLNNNFKKKYWSIYDYINCYILWSGNDGYYPHGKDGFSKYAESVGLKNIYQEDRTNDYLITTVIFMSYLQCMKNNKCFNSITFKNLFNSIIKTIAGPYYLHTYLCYSPTSNFYWLPWQWEFIPQFKNNQWMTPVTLEYILFQKK